MNRYAKRACLLAAPLCGLLAIGCGAGIPLYGNGGGGSNPGGNPSSPSLPPQLVGGPQGQANGAQGSTSPQGPPGAPFVGTSGAWTASCSNPNENNVTPCVYSTGAAGQYAYWGVYYDLSHFSADQLAPYTQIHVQGQGWGGSFTNASPCGTGGLPDPAQPNPGYSLAVYDAFSGTFPATYYSTSSATATDFNFSMNVSASGVGDWLFNGSGAITGPTLYLTAISNVAGVSGSPNTCTSIALYWITVTLQ